MKRIIKSDMTGKQLRKIRTDCGISAKGLGKYLKISMPYVYSLEYGKHPVSQEIKDKMIKLFNFFENKC